MDELVRWLGEQLDEDERIARAASGEEWGAVSPTQPYTVFDVAAYRANTTLRTVGAIAGVERTEDRVHIAAHDPARVLREIDAKRQLLNDYAVTARIRDEAAARIKAAGDQPDSKDLDTWDRAQREAAILEGPVKLSALVYVDRHGYLEAWRP